VKVQERGNNAAPAHMGHFVRPMRMEDIAQVAACEQECFPTSWSTTPFQRELQNKAAAYLVACRASVPANAREEAMAMLSVATPIPPARPVLKRIVSNIKEAISPQGLPRQDLAQHIAGYVGLWFVLDEAHITAIGTRERDRRKGVGELLLIASVEVAQQRGSLEVTLETRVSNYPAQGLYIKYGFREVGVRKGYYTDNHEDALVMTTPNITTPEYQARFDVLRREHADRWGQSVRILS
jgi:ribosomal-protein-alanine N-acetyltransferase